jgi:hypothetical protein
MAEAATNATSDLAAVLLAVPAYIMLTGLKQPLRPGDEFPITLGFEKAGQVTTTTTLRKAGAGMHTGRDAMRGMNMQNMPMQPGQGQ